MPAGYTAARPPRRNGDPGGRCIPSPQLLPLPHEETLAPHAALPCCLVTAVHRGTFRLSARPDGVVGQNLLGAAALSLVLSAVLGLMARGTTIAFGITPTMTLTDFVVVSTLGGLMASVFVGAAKIGRAHV